MGLGWPGLGHLEALNISTKSPMGPPDLSLISGIMKAGDYFGPNSTTGDRVACRSIAINPSRDNAFTSILRRRLPAGRARSPRCGSAFG
jgi:hypothetical protein